MTTKLLHRQRGNTITGIIIGLIVGLGIAVVVALAITKGASPFTDKGPKQSKVDVPPGQVADPNKPLYGSRDAAREANKELQAKATKAAEDPLGAAIAGMNANGGTAPAAPAAPATASTAPAAAAPAAAPNGAAPAAPRTAATGAPGAPAAPAAAAPAAKAEGDVVYYLQAGAFKEMNDAEASRAKLALLGFEAAISDRTTDGGVLHRVRIGPFAQAEAMNKARAKLSENGVDVAIVRNQR